MGAEATGLMPAALGQMPQKPPGQIPCQHNQRVEDNDESDLTELDIEEGEGLEEYKDVDKEEEEEEDDVEEEANEDKELVSSQDIEHSVIVVAPRR